MDCPVVFCLPKAVVTLYDDDVRLKFPVRVSEKLVVFEIN